MALMQEKIDICLSERRPRFEYRYADPADWWKEDQAIRYVREPAPEERSVSLKQEFERLAAKWKEETAFHSSLSIKYTHPAYQRIIGMGLMGLPLVLRDLERNPERWFYALKFMAGEDPAEGVEGLEPARQAWLN